jgi:methylated-DNA-protein-cysteine methyltransferase-like protein
MKKKFRNRPAKIENEDFFSRVYDIVRLIPTGRVTSYGAIARFIGSPQSSRMVGWAMNASHHVSEIIPAHRVVNRNGLLTGRHHFRHPDLMQQLLESEGIKVENERIINFNEVFWDPYKELF